MNLEIIKNKIINGRPNKRVESEPALLYAALQTIPYLIYKELKTKNLTVDDFPNEIKQSLREAEQASERVYSLDSPACQLVRDQHTIIMPVMLHLDEIEGIYNTRRCSSATSFTDLKKSNAEALFTSESETDFKFGETSVGMGNSVNLVKTTNPTTGYESNYVMMMANVAGSGYYTPCKTRAKIHAEGQDELMAKSYLTIPINDTYNLTSLIL